MEIMGSTISMAKLFYLVPDSESILEGLMEQKLHDQDLIAALQELKSSQRLKTFDGVDIAELIKLPLVLSISDSESHSASLELIVYQSGNIIGYRYEGGILSPVGIKPRSDVDRGELSMSEEQYKIILDAASEYSTKTFGWSRNDDGTYSITSSSSDASSASSASASSASS
jgi:hypothetical protein